MGYIYKITNKINGKSYIGQTIKSVKDRWREHKNSSNYNGANDYDTYLHTAMRKYKINNFSVEEIEKCTNEDLNDREIFWIDYYQSFYKLNGYNLTLGGSGSLKYTDDDILYMWQKCGSIGAIHDEFGIDEGWASKRLKLCGVTAEEIRARGYEIVKHKRSNMIHKYSLNGEYIESFDSIQDARRITGIGHIEKCCAGKQKQAGGFQWSKELFDRLPPVNNTKAQITPREVLQILVDTKEIVAEYKTISEASRLTGIDISGIAKVCKDIQVTAGGYIWIYKYDYARKYAT